MGGDVGPRITMRGAIAAVEKDPHLSLLLFGDSSQITPFLDALPSPTCHDSPDSPARTLHQRLRIFHTDKVISNHASIKEALRHSRGSSMRAALEAVRDGTAQGCVSAGNTGALMGLAKHLIQPIAHIQRPALVSIIPALPTGKQAMLDLGANVQCDAAQLVQFAQMGSIFAKHYLGCAAPRVALLNIGTESHKGTPAIREAAELLPDLVNYVGFLESDKLLAGQADVIVQDGFVGNIALKTLEGTVKQLHFLLKNSGVAIKSRGVIARLSDYLRRFVYHQVEKKLQAKWQALNPEQYNGASLLGLQAVVVKSHGSANEHAFAHAINQAAMQVRLDLVNKMTTDWANLPH